MIKLGNFLTDLAIKFPTKKKDQNQRYKLRHVEIFPESDRDIMWKFINRYLAKMHKEVSGLRDVDSN
jgi:hypothetical protein